MDSAWIVLTTDGQDLKFHYYRVHTLRRDDLSVPVLNKGQSTDLGFFEAKLYRDVDGKVLSLNGVDGFGGFWKYDGLRPGKYLLSFKYISDGTTIDGGVPYWKGNVKTESVTIEIKEAEAVY